jgi:hypothetical protein
MYIHASIFSLEIKEFQSSPMSPAIKRLRGMHILQDQSHASLSQKIVNGELRYTTKKLSQI